ncbi:MAG: hypothetical protein OEW89_03900 [Gammaproteobacteria bacterium]|nr:hypothetical protein [Gammaproteobacteria bacterium]MDH5595071.1 hypothetical protein [Gammaproteobacteria bacterium]
MGFLKNLFGKKEKLSGDELPKNLYMGNTRLDLLCISFQLFDHEQMRKLDEDTMMSFAEKLIPDISECRRRDLQITYAKDHEEAVANTAWIKSNAVAKHGSVFFGEMGFRHENMGVVFALSLVVYGGQKDTFTIMHKPIQWATTFKVK